MISGFVVTVLLDNYFPHWYFFSLDVSGGSSGLVSGFSWNIQVENNFANNSMLGSDVYY